MVNDKKPTTAACYQIALSRLRRMYDSDFHEILAAVYEEHGLQVTKRRSRVQAQRERDAMDLARSIVASSTVEAADIPV